MKIRPALALIVLIAAVFGGRSAVMAESLDQRIYQAFVDGNYARAAGLIEEHLEFSPNDEVMLYNAACAYSLLRQSDRAVAYLRRSVDAGLRDVDQITRDPDLDPIRGHPLYKSLVGRLTRAAVARRTDSLKRWKETFGEHEYRYDMDDERHIAYATALDETSYVEMRSMIEREADFLRATLFRVTPRSTLLIAVPTPADARRLFSDERTGGIYEHDFRRLIARDTGSSLRHELVHALHYAHMDAIGQRHPLWIQEGLATLHEDYVLSPDGGILFVHNERHNFVKDLARGGRLVRWSALFALDDESFMHQASKLYPQVRSIFEYVAAEGKLGCWYDALIETFSDDPTGAKAFEVCFGSDLDTVERAWRAWLRASPWLDTTVEYGDASLGIETELNSSNDGVLVARVLPGSAAARGELRAGDVIVSVDGKPTRSMPELRTIIAARHVGESVSVRARRGDDYFTVVVSLQPLGPILW